MVINRLLCEMNYLQYYSNETIECVFSMINKHSLNISVKNIRKQMLKKSNERSASNFIWRVMKKLEDLRVIEICSISGGCNKYNPTKEILEWIKTFNEDFVKGETKNRMNNEIINPFKLLKGERKKIIS